MKYFSITAKIIGLLILLSGCASGPPVVYFTENPDQTLSLPSPDKAQVIFLEPINSIQGLFPVGLFEVNGSEHTHIATTGAHSKVALEFTPGQHQIMANHSGMKAHIMKMNVEAGKRYYVLLRFVYGNGFQLRPLRLSGSSDYTVQNKKFDGWNEKTSFVEQTPESVAFFERIKDRVDRSQAAGLKSWGRKSAEQQAELTLNLEDGVKP